MVVTPTNNLITSLNSQMDFAQSVGRLPLTKF